MGGDQKLIGPDLTQGVPADSVPAGGRVVGHADGEAVLLARLGEEYVAIGATCTHYGGPLGEGVIVGDTVRCPWHHACFNLRTGEALCAPALSPVPRWTVERRSGDIVAVTKKIERDPLAPTYPVGQTTGAAPGRVVILGAGAAGTAAAEMLRRCGYEGTITVVDKEHESPYDRPNLSKDYLAGNAPEEWIPIRPPKFYIDHKIDLVRGTATRIDVPSMKLEIDGRPPLPYDALLLAMGAEPIRLPLPGADLPHVHTLRSLLDSRAIIAAAKDGKRAVVIGASFIGLEVAASLRTRGLEVDVVAPESLPLERILGRELGTFIKSLHESKGVRFHLEHKPERIEKDTVVLDNGMMLPADLVVLGVGVRPRLQLAEIAGLKVDRGVVVDAYLETSESGVFAAGDIARYPDVVTGEAIRVEHWVVAERMGQTAARNILGARERFGDVPFFWSAHYDVSINYVGHAEKWDNVVVDGSAEQRDVAVRFERAGKLLALATIYRDELSLQTEIEMERSPT